MVNFIKAVYNPEKRIITAFTDEHRCEDFDVYTQEEFDNYITLENLKENIEESGEQLPECYESFEEYARDLWEEGEAERTLFDLSYSDQHENICKLAGVDINTPLYLSWACSYPESMYDGL